MIAIFTVVIYYVRLVSAGVQPPLHSRCSQHKMLVCKVGQPRASTTTAGGHHPAPPAGEDVLALRRDVKPRPLEAFMLLNPWGKQADSFPEQSTLMWLQGVNPLGLVGLYELGGLFQPKFYESMVLSLQSGVRHKQAFILTEMLHFSPPPCDLAKHSQFCLSHGMTAGPDPSSCRRFGFYSSLLAPLLSYQT